MPSDIRSFFGGGAPRPAEVNAKTSLVNMAFTSLTAVCALFENSSVMRAHSLAAPRCIILLSSSCYNKYLFLTGRNIFMLFPRSTIQTPFVSRCPNTVCSSRVHRSLRRNNEDAKYCLTVVMTRSKQRPKRLRSKKPKQRRRSQSRRWKKQPALTTLRPTGRPSLHGLLRFALNALQPPTVHPRRLQQKLPMDRHHLVAAGQLGRKLPRVMLRQTVMMLLLS
jgi:hypothetical protein